MAEGSHAGTLPKVGLTVASPQQNEGQRSEPAISFPWCMGPNPAAAADEAPPEDPPGLASSFQGFSVLPCKGLSVVNLIDNSGVFVRPMMIAPDFFKLLTIGASAGAIKSANAGKPLGVGFPSTSTLVFIVTGTPCNSPVFSPDDIARSASLAAIRASSL